jgi:dienelactone hydrolase
MVLFILALQQLPAQEPFFELDFLRPTSNNIGWLKYSDAQNFLYYHLSDQVYSLLEEREKNLSAIKTPEQWQQRQAEIKEILSNIAAPLPEKNKLNARVLKVIEKDGYRIENVVYESRPGYFVTASIYIPSLKKTKKFPAVIFCSGHSFNGYRSRGYQHTIVNLVKKGFVVLAYDPQGQGERLEYLDPVSGECYFKQRVTFQHSYPGAQALISGQSQANYMIWDGIRTVDYLVSRKDVDPERIGITGGSGGGTQSAMIAAMDERIYAAAPERFITGYKRLFESVGPQDAEQNLFASIKEGIDHADLLTVRAPKPLLVISTTNDFFSIQGARETVARVTEIYNTLNKPGNISMAVDTDRHASTRKNREAMYAFFQEHLNNPGSATDIDVEIPAEDELRVTASGQVLTSLNSETVFSQNSQYADRLMANLIKARKEPDHIKSTIESAKKLSGYRKPSEIVEPVYAGHILREGYTIERYFCQGEGEYVVPYLLMLPSVSNGMAILYIHPEGKSAEASENGEIERFVKAGYTVLAPDLPGTGETGPGTFRGDANIEGVSYNLLFASNLIGRSILGIRAGDLTRLTGILKEQENVEDIYGYARGEMTPVLLHAAAFDPLISGIILMEPLISYHSLVTEKFYKPSFVHAIVPGSHLKYDLPDLAAAVAPRKLLLVNPVDGAGNLANQQAAEKEWIFTDETYQAKGASSSFATEYSDDPIPLILKWLE